MQASETLTIILLMLLWSALGLIFSHYGINLIRSVLPCTHKTCRTIKRFIIIIASYIKVFIAAATTSRSSSSNSGRRSRSSGIVWYEPCAHRRHHNAERVEKKEVRAEQNFIVTHNEQVSEIVIKFSTCESCLTTLPDSFIVLYLFIYIQLMNIGGKGEDIIMNIRTNCRVLVYSYSYEH